MSAENLSEMNPMPAPEGRLAFHEQVTVSSQAIAHQMLLMIPELLAVGIVPVWDLPVTTGLPNMIQYGRNGKLTHPTELTRMLQQTVASLPGQVGNIAAMLHDFDRHMSRLAKDITAAEGLLAQRKKELDVLTATNSSEPADATAGGAGPGVVDGHAGPATDLPVGSGTHR